MAKIKNLLSLSLLFSILFLTSCKDNDNTVSVPEPTSKILTTRYIKNPDLPQYFKFSTADTSQTNWDVKFTVVPVIGAPTPTYSPSILLNSQNEVVAKIVDSLEFTNVSFDTTGFQHDEDSTYVIGTNCFQYSHTTHQLLPYQNRTFIVRTTDNKLVKFKMLSYYNEQNQSGYMKLEYLIKQ